MASRLETSTARSNKALVIFGREWLEIRHNRTLLTTMAFAPVLMVILPLMIIVFLNIAIPEFAYNTTPQSGAVNANIGGIGGSTGAEVLASIIGICFSFFLPIPAVLPMTIATNSIVAEKETRSLEPLLAAPIRSIDILIGKALSAIVPTVLIVYVAFFTLLIVIETTINKNALGLINKTLGPWAATILIWSPLLAGLTVMVGIAISSRVNDARTAQQLGGLVVLPLLLYVALQALVPNVAQMGWLTFGIGTLLLLVGNVIATNVALRLFERENILTRWR